MKYVSLKIHLTPGWLWLDSFDFSIHLGYDIVIPQCQLGPASLWHLYKHIQLIDAWFVPMSWLWADKQWGSVTPRLQKQRGEHEAPPPQQVNCSFLFAAICFGVYIFSVFDFCFFTSTDRCSAERRRQLPTHSRLRQSAGKGAAKDRRRKNRYKLFSQRRCFVAAHFKEHSTWWKTSVWWSFCVSRHYGAPTRAASPCTSQWDTRSVWTRLFASHTAAAATGSLNPSDRYKHTFCWVLRKICPIGNKITQWSKETKAELISCVGEKRCSSLV